MKKRPNSIWIRYEVWVDGEVKYRGITTNLKFRKEHHRLRWPHCVIKAVENKVTHEAGKKWEETERLKDKTKGRVT